MSFSKKIISWYEKNKRDLPWRNTRDAYTTWLSEIILQQTRVEQGMPYFFRFIEAFPAVKDLAHAKEDTVLKLWQGLGYYSRARNLHATAKEIVKKHNGIFPEEAAQLKLLKGIGDYTAAAVSSIAFNRPYAAVDGNVYRVLSRVFGIKTPIDSPQGKKQFSDLAHSLLDKKNPSAFNQALMEIGALICKPVNPLCPDCPLQAECYSFEKKKWKSFPVKSKKQKVKERFFHYLVLKKENHYYIRKRTEKDIWKGLYEFPLVETARGISWNALKKNKNVSQLTAKLSLRPEKKTGPLIHLLSHQKITAHFYMLEIASGKNSFLKKNYLEIPAERIGEFALPRLIDRFVQSYSNGIFSTE